MYYAVMFIMMVNGQSFLLVEPQRDLVTCREVARIMYENRDERYPDARCVAIIMDNKENEK
jgi:hypothetical protein